MSTTPHHFAAIGECMIELSSLEGNTHVMNYAGDTLNTAVYFARSTDLTRVAVHYATALGADPYSQQMLEQWGKEGIQIDCVHQLPGKLPGLYLIHNDKSGERSFYYYRSQAAAREMFQGIAGDLLCEQLLNFNTLYLSGISLAILYESGCEKLMHLLKTAHRKGISICFDTNYRPRLWSSAEMARSVINPVLTLAQIALPSFDDEQQLYGDRTPEATASRLHQMGVQEVVVKQGAVGYLLSDHTGQRQMSAHPVQNMIDSTAAGDAFNGAYLAARLQGLEPEEAAQTGAELAARVITQKGAIIPS